MLRVKHLGADSACPAPPSDPKALRIYSMLFCPFAQRVFLVTVAKGIKPEVINVNVTDRPKWMLEKYPGGKVPLLETSAGVLSESLTISEYLDQLPSSNTPLANSDLFERAQDKNWAEQFQSVISTIVTLFFGEPPITDPKEATRLLDELVTKLKPFDKELAKRGTKFFGGAAGPRILDYMMWPFIERFPVLKILYMKLVPKLDLEFKESCPTLARWVKEMEGDTAVKSTKLEPQDHFTYINGRRGGNIDYDILMELE